MTYSVYRILNTVNDKAYIGVSTNPKKRISDHFTGKGSVLVKEDVDRHGRAVFMSQVVGMFHEEHEANKVMAHLIMRHNALYPNGYNKAIGGKGSSGHIWDLEQREKVSGERNNRSKLTEAQVAVIFWDSRPRSKIAEEFGISTTMVTKIKSGKAWKHITKWLIVRDVP